MRKPKKHDVEDLIPEGCAGLRVEHGSQPVLVPDFYQTMLEHLVDGVYFVDANRNITYWNQGAERLTGYSKDEVVGRCCAHNLLVHVDDSGTQLCTSQCPLTHAMANRTSHTAEVYLRHKSGHRVPVSVRIVPILDRRSKVLGAVEVFSDISPQKAAQAHALELEQMAFLDSLTQINNRRYLQMNLERMFSEFPRYGHPFGILLFDVDHFKSVNDRYGHGVGDAVLTAVAKTLSVNLRTSDLLGRWGGEEFLVLLPNITRDHLSRSAERCRLLVEGVSVPCEATRVGTTISCGGTMVEPGDTIETAMARADESLYRSKEEGRNRVTIMFRDDAPLPATLAQEDYGPVRRWPRYKIDVPVRLFAQRPTIVDMVQGHGRKLGRGGMAVVAGIDVSLNEQVAVEFTPPNSEQPIKVRGFVRNRTGDTYGIEYITENDADYNNVGQLESVLNTLGLVSWGFS